MVTFLEKCKRFRFSITAQAHTFCLWRIEMFVWVYAGVSWQNLFLTIVQRKCRELMLFTSLGSWWYCRRARNKVLVAEPLEASGEAARNTYFKVPLPILLAASPLASGGSAAKTLFRARLQYRQLRRLAFYVLNVTFDYACDDTFFEHHNNVSVLKLEHVTRKTDINLFRASLQPKNHACCDQSLVVIVLLLSHDLNTLAPFSFIIIHSSIILHYTKSTYIMAGDLSKLYWAFLRRSPYFSNCYLNIYSKWM